MGRNSELRKVIKARLMTLILDPQFTGIEESGIAFRRVDPKVAFPHIVFDFPTMSPNDEGREDFVLDVHIWTRDQWLAYELQEAVVDLFSFYNAPQDTILPTFYLTSAGEVDDPDKNICHLVVRLQAQNYER